MQNRKKRREKKTIENTVNYHISHYDQSFDVISERSSSFRIATVYKIHNIIHTVFAYLYGRLRNHCLCECYHRHFSVMTDAVKGDVRGGGCD